MGQVQCDWLFWAGKRFWGFFHILQPGQCFGQGIVVIIHLLIDAFQSRRQTGQNGRFSKNWLQVDTLYNSKHAVRRRSGPKKKSCLSSSSPLRVLATDCNLADFASKASIDFVSKTIGSLWVKVGIWISGIWGSIIQQWFIENTNA